MLNIPVIVLLLITACSPSQKDQTAENIDLSVWKITLPIDNDNDGRPDSYGPAEMEEAIKKGSLKPYFYKADDDALVFYCEINDQLATTKNSKYPRSELREQIESGNNNVNWTLEDGGRMKAKIQVTKATRGARFMVMQIHGRLTTTQRELIGKDDNDAPPLLKIYYSDGQIEVAYKVLKNKGLKGSNLLIKSNWTDAKHYYFSTSVGNEPFDLEIAATSGKLEVILNGTRKEFTDPDLYVWPFENYFKAGNYLTSRNQSAHSEVKFFHLITEH